MRHGAAGSLLVVFAAACPSRADDMSVMKGRLYEHFLAEGAPNPATIQGYLNAQLADGSWPDIDYANRDRNVWPPVNHLYRVEYMAKAYRTAGHEHYNSPSVLNACSKGLDYWYARNPQSDNWWWNEIGAQLTLRKPLILLEILLTPTQITAGCSILNRPSTSRTGQNLVWAAESHAVKGLLQISSSTVSWALGLIAGTIVMTTSEGVQPDYSFQQHGETLYSGGYGAGFTHDCAFWINVARSTAFAFSQSKVDLAAGHLLDGQRWMTRGRMFDPGVHGRGITRKDYCTAWEIVDPCLWLTASGAGTGRDSEILALYNQIRQATPANQPAVMGNKHFWHSDYMTHSRPGYFMSTRMFSTRNYNTDDYINGEGKRSHHIADGCTFIFLDGEEYFNIFGVWDWYRIPGATVEYGTSLNPGSVQYKGSRSFVGGVSDGTYGMSAMDHAAGTLTARKTWFYFDNEIVCLGAGINSSTANPVITSMNQCLLAGAVTVQNAQGLQTLSAGDHTLAGTRWVHHDGVGYLFPDSPTTRLKNQAQSNTWNYINDLYPAGEIDTRNVFTLWIEHGAYAASAAYSYVVVPDISAAQLDDYAQTSPVSIRSLTPSVQAVENASLGIVEAAFFAAGSIAASDGQVLAVDQPCLVMLRKLTGQLEVGVANPNNASLNVNVDINRQLSGTGATWDAASGTTRVAFALPSGNDAGKSVVRVLAEADDAQVVGSSIPASLLTGETVAATVTMRNTGTATWTRAAGYKLGAVGDSDPFAGPRQLLPSGVTVSPGQQYTFSFVMTAPGEPGTYLTDWRMVHEGVRWFGDTDSSTVRVEVPVYPGDFDLDGDVDQEDFGILQVCYTRVGQTVSDACQPADLNGDSAVNLTDFGVFQACFGGPDNPPACPPKAY